MARKPRHLKQNHCILFQMTDLIDPQGNRLYLTAAERAAFLTAAAKALRSVILLPGPSEHRSE